MTIPNERWLLDTNVWVFGLRRDPAFPDCSRLLDRIGSFIVIIPRQVLKELNLNFTLEEVSDFYNLVNHYPEAIELNWEPAPPERVRFFSEHGCRKGDAVIAAHAEALSVDVIVTENRQFLQTVAGLTVEVLTSPKALARLAA